MRNSLIALSLAAMIGAALPADAASARTGSVQTCRLASLPAGMTASVQDPVQDYERREARAQGLEEFSGGAVGIVAAVLIVLLVLLLI